MNEHARSRTRLALPKPDEAADGVAAESNGPV